MSTRIEQILALGQSVWCDSISRSMIETGQLQGFIDAGIVGMTSNPSIFHKAISKSNDYDPKIEALVAAGADAAAVYESLVVEDVRDAADLLRPVYDRTDGVDGYVSLEANPHLAHDAQGTVAEARHLFQLLDRPNVFIKVPATVEGVGAIETLIGEGINVNVTLIFSLEMYAKVMEAYIRGLERLADAGGDVSRTASVASFFVSRVDTLVDKKLHAMIDAGGTDNALLLGKAAIGNAKLAYARFKEVFRGERFNAMRNRGGRVQRPLWASTSTKNPTYLDTLYVDTLIGPDTVNTLPLATIDAVQDHGTADVTIDKNVDIYRQHIADIESAGISMEVATSELLAAGVSAFVDSFDALMLEIRAKMTHLQTA